MRLSTERAWSEAIAMLARHGALLLPVFGLFALLPSLVTAEFLPMEPVEATTLQQLADAIEGYFRANAPWIILGGLLTAFAQAAVLTLLADPGHLTVGQALQRGLALTPSIYVYQAITYLLIGFGLSFFLIPGLYLLGRLSFGDVWMAAGRHYNPLTAIARSWQASRGQGWRIAFLIALIFLVGLLAGWAAGLVFGVAGSLIGGAEAGRAVSVAVSTVIATATHLVILLARLSAWRQVGGEASSGT